MRGKNIIMFIFFLVSIFFVLLNIYPAFGADMLILSGVVKDINYKAKIVVVDVKSSSCPGIRSFKIDDPSKLDSKLIGKKISFPIDSSTCKGDVVYKMYWKGK